MTNIYLITYDLKTPGNDYRSLFEALMGLGEARHSMQNIWFLKSSNTYTAIRDHLKKYIDSNDVLFVTKVSSWAALNLKDASWLNE